MNQFSDTMPEVIGWGLLPKDDKGHDLHCIGTIFPFEEVVIVGPGVHALQKMDYINRLNRQRQEAGLPPLTDEQVRYKIENTVDLVVRAGIVYIRPHPDQMDLAFMADEILQKLVPKHKIKFLHLNNAAIRQAVESRGECWRISHAPKTSEEMRKRVQDSRIAIGARAMYYYSMRTGTRHLTYDEFEQLGALPAAELAACLKEIKDHAGRRNARLHPEVEFFRVDRERFGPADFQALDLDWNDETAVRQAHALLARKFRAATPPEFLRDDVDNTEWRNALLEALLGNSEEEVSEVESLGLAAEFFMKVQWLPGARIEEGELLFDTVYETCGLPGADPALADLCSETHRVKEYIFNAFRNHPDMEAVNIGRVEESLSRRQSMPGMRGVYVSLLCFRNGKPNSLKVIRMQKWDIWQYLDEGKDLGTAMLRTAEYTNYILDRHLGCRQLGMAVPPVAPGKVMAVYKGRNAQYQGLRFWATYFERSYIHGRSTDKMPPAKFASSRYALMFARLLGEAAAANIIAGRVGPNGEPLFDDGDEIIQETPDRLPARIVVGDFTGAFADYSTPLELLAIHYARPMNRRLNAVANKQEFVREYLEAFQERFEMIQAKYLRHKAAFHLLFSHERYDPGGSFSYRWEKVLSRLADTNPMSLARKIRHYVTL